MDHLQSHLRSRNDDEGQFSLIVSCNPRLNEKSRNLLKETFQLKTTDYVGKNEHHPKLQNTFLVFQRKLTSDSIYSANV